MVYIESYFPHFPYFPTDTNASSFVNYTLGLPAPLPDHVMFTDGLTGSSISALEKSLETLELDGEGRRMERRARCKRDAGSLDERMQGVKTLRAKQSVDGDPFRTPELRVVNINV